MKNIVFILLAVVFSCSNVENNREQKPAVTVSIIPQKFFVDKIAGDWLDVNVMIPPGGSPATYEPTPMQMKQLSRSKAYFLIGHITFEKAWRGKLQSVSPKTKFIDTSEGLDLISEEGWGDENTQSDTKHEAKGYNPHIWLSPELVKQQSKIIFDSLAVLFPEHKQEMSANLDKFILQCDSVQKVLNEQLKGAKGTGFIVYHPVWTYLAKEYGLRQIAIEHNGKEATARMLKRVIDFAKSNDINIVFVQKEFSDNQARTIAKEINGRVVRMNPLDYNWFNTMKEFGETFSEMQNKTSK